MTADLSNLVVEVLHNRGDDNHPDWSVGSGFFVGTRLVLTALHNVDGQGELLMRVHGKEERPALLRLQGDKDIVDLAVLEVPDVAVDVPPLRYGAVDRSARAVVEQCWAVGFPRFKERVHDPKPLRFSAQVDGEIPTGENLDQPLLTLQVRRSPRPLPSSAVRESEWAGMSGATVFSGNNIIVGVITEHHLPEGESALTVVPITALDLLPEAEATKWWELLGVDRQAFVRLPGEAASSLSISARPESFIPIPHSPLFQPRPDEFENLERLLFESKRENPSPRLGLVGMAGVGKTQLAVELAHRCLDQNRFPAGIFWMTAMGKDLYDWQPRFAQLARDTGYLPPDDDVSSAENERRRAIHFCRYLADHQDALLILDNVEDPGLVMMALPTLAGREVACSILYTSRITLSPEGATTYPVEPLSKENALRLLLQETREPLLTQIEAKLPNAEAKNARDICQSVGYLPLALKHLHDLLRRDRHLTLARLLQELIQRRALKLIQPLFPTFQLSWEQVQGEEAQRLFKLACYFPEATPIPLWLLGLAAGLGEEGDILTQLGEARVELQELSLMEELSEDQVRLHPLVREFGLRLVEGAGDKGKTLLEEAGERLVSEFTDLNQLERRARREGYWNCLEQARAAYEYTELLETDKTKQLGSIERWLGRESYLLGNEQWWPKTLPGLLYQQLFNRSLEEGHPLIDKDAPLRWLRQESQVGAEDQALVRVFKGHTGGVRSVAFSPDGTRIVTGSEDGTAQLWEVTNGKVLATLEGHTGRVSSVAFLPDGTKIVTGSKDGTARLWEAASGQEMVTFTGHESEVTCVAFSPDGTRIVTGSRDGTAQLWEVTSGKVLATLARERLNKRRRRKSSWWQEDHSGTVRSVAFSPDGTKIVIGPEDGTVRLWEVASGQEVTKIVASASGLRGVAFSPDGSKIMTIDSDGEIVHIWEVVSGQETATFPIAESVSEVGDLSPIHFALLSAALSPDGTKVVLGSTDGVARLWEVVSGQLLSTFVAALDVTSLAFSPDGTKIVTGSYDGTTRLWEVANGRVLASLGSFMSEISRVAFSPDGTRIATGSNDGMLQLWDVANGQVLTTFGDRSYMVSWVAFSPDGTRIAADTGSRTQLWDVASQQVLTTFPESGCMAFSPDGTQIVFGSYDGTARLWEAASGQVMVAFTGHESQVTCVAFSPDGTRIVTGSEDGTARLWEAASGQKVTKIVASASGLRGVAFSPDGSKIMTIDSDGEIVHIWEVVSGQETATFPIAEPVPETAMASDLLSAAFSPDGTKVVLGFLNRTVRLWEVVSGQLLSTFVADEAASVRSLAFSPDGTRIMTGSYGGRLRLWEVANGRRLASLGSPISQISSVAFSPDGTRIVIGSEDGTVRLWEVARMARELVTFTGHESEVTCVAFSPDGTRIVTGSEDGTARLWEAASGREMVTFTGHESQVTCVAVSPDGTRIVTGSYDGTARLWEAASGKEVSRFVNYDKTGVMCVAFSPDGHLVIICDTHNYVFLCQLNKAEMGSLLDLYVTAYRVGAIYWRNNTHVVLADTGGSLLCPHFYQLKLEGIW